MESKDLSNNQKHLLNKLVKCINDGNGMWVYGTFGIGKTSIANLLIKRIDDTNNKRIESNNGKKILYIPTIINFARLLRQYKDSWGNNDNTTNPMYLYMRTKTLIIDDIGAENIWGNNPEAFIEQLYDFFNYRMDNNLTTIFLSNLSIDAYRDQYKLKTKDNMRIDRLFERIESLSNYDEFNLIDKNYRRK